jgi:predicted amidohydrolase
MSSGSTCRARLWLFPLAPTIPSAQWDRALMAMAHSPGIYLLAQNPVGPTNQTQVMEGV